MTALAPVLDGLTLSVTEETRVQASLDATFAALLEELGPAGQMPDGKPFPMVIEARPGGRWYRDLGNNAGHLWGHVQVIKPPGLLELCGPLFMSFPGVNHVQYRLTAEGAGTRLKFSHRAFGQIPQEVLDGVGQGWDYKLKRIREMAERRNGERRNEKKR